ncbi:MAG: TonB-dependent receptor [Bacteroidales bacterium]
MGRYPSFIGACLLLFSLGWPGTAIMAQESGTVSGVVTDSASGKAMVAVNISADHRSGTITDGEGAFTLRLKPGAHQIGFYYVGYEEVSQRVVIEAGKTVRLDIGMKMSSRMLDEVVVSASKYEEKLSDVTVSLEVIKPYQLSDQNITSLDDILEKTPGISILDGQPSIRGGSGFSYGVGSRVLMLVDDLPMISGDAGDIKWNYMPVENLNQVEVIKGASSVLYGSSALNGVINLRTKFPGNEPSTEITAFGGVYMNPRNKQWIWWDRQPVYAGASFSHLRKVGNLDLSVGGNYFRDEGYREYDYEHRIRGNLALRYRFSKIRGLVAGVSSSAMYIDQSDFLLWLDADSAYRQNPLTYAPLFGYRYNIDPYVEYFTSKGDKHSLKTRLYSVGNSTLDSDKSSFAKVWYAEYRYLKKLWNQSNWTSGVSFSRNTVLANLYENHRGANLAFYTQLDAHFFKRLKISSGIRWETNSLNGELYYSLPVLRAGINYQAGKATFLRASVGQGYRFPSVAEKYADARVGSVKIFPNPDLEPERGWGAEAGVKQGFAIGSWEGLADAALFWTEYSNMIEYIFGAYPPDSVEIPTLEDVGFKALNIGTARITGVEISLAFSGNAGPIHVRFSGGYTYMNPVDPTIMEEMGKGEDEAYVLKYRRRHLFKSDLEVSLGKFFTGANFQYNSRMINVDEVFIDPFIGGLLQPGFPAYWEAHASGYTLTDFRIGMNITEIFRLNFILKNAFNVEYLGRPGDIGPPRSITLQARLAF